LADPSKKMSKSLGDKHYVSLFEGEDSIRKKVRSAVTDTGDNQGNTMSPGVENLFNLIKACEKTNAYNALLKDYESGTLKYKELKDTTADALVELAEPIRKKKEELMADRASIEKLAGKLSEKACEVASLTLAGVRELTGLPAIR
jgi:tryptophanyl-tRNA synthetase